MRVERRQSEPHQREQHSTGRAVRLRQLLYFLKVVAVEQFGTAGKPAHPGERVGEHADCRLNSGLSWSAETIATGQTIRCKWRIGLNAASSSVVIFR